MKYIPLSFDVNLRPDGFVVDRDSPFAGLTGLQDRREARGLRHALLTALVFLLRQVVWGGLSARDGPILETS
jgi:hypothetical protein